MDFEGKVALVTGAAGGIGGALARALTGEGAKVAVTDVDGPGAEAVGKELGTFSDAMDVTSFDMVKDVVDRATSALGPFDLLFNVAGIHTGSHPLPNLPMDIYDRVLAINLRGMLITTQILGNQMIANERRGAMVNVGSVAGFRPGGGGFDYGVSKVGVHALTQAAAKEFAQYGIRVNAVAPGPIATPMTGGFKDPAAREAWESRVPLHRIAEPSDIVDLMIFLASDRAKNITGAIVATDGGMSA